MLATRDIDLNSTVDAYENVQLAAGDNIMIDGDVTSQSGNVNMEAGEDVEVGSESVIEAVVGQVLADADGDFIMENGTVIVAGDDTYDAVVIEAAGIVIDQIFAEAPGAGIQLTARESSITNSDADGDDLHADAVFMDSILGIGVNPIPEGRTAPIFIEGAEIIDTLTTGDNGGTWLESSNPNTTNVWARTLGEDADILLNHIGCCLDLEFVATQNGDIIVTSNGNINARHVWALDAGVINPDDPTDPVPSHNGSGISSLPDNNGMTGIADDAHYVSITSTGTITEGCDLDPDDIGCGGDIYVLDVKADYYAEITSAGGDLLIGTDGLGVAGDAVLTASTGSIVDYHNSDATNIWTTGDLTLAAGNMIGEASDGDPLEVEVGGALNLIAVDGAPYFSGKRHVWAFLNGTSGDGSINFVGSGDAGTPPGLIVWNTQVFGGPENPLLRIERARTGFTREMASLIQEYQNRVWDWGFVYFPHVWAMLDKIPPIMNIEYILDGNGVIEGLPEGVGPDSVDMTDLDDTFSYNF
jgi:hypothetical protein